MSDPVSAITAAAPFWGPIVGVLLLAVAYLFKSLIDSYKDRIADGNKHNAELAALTKSSIENDKDRVHVDQAQNELIKGLGDLIRSRPNV